MPTDAASAGKIPHPLEQSERSQALQRAKSSTHWNNHPANKPLNDPKRPPTGEIRTQHSLPTGRLFHPLEESVRSDPHQRPKTSTHWNNHPANKPLNDPKRPPTGEIRTQHSLPTGRLFHPLEESVRSDPHQRPKTSTHWNNPDAQDLGRIKQNPGDQWSTGVSSCYFAIHASTR